MIEGPEPARGASATGHPASSTPELADRSEHEAFLPNLVRLGLGSLWSAQIGPATPRGFVLVVAGTPFELPGDPPARPGSSIAVRVVDDGPLPAFELVTEPAAQLANAAARAVVASAVERAVGERLETPVAARTDFGEAGPVRIDVLLPTPEPRPRCRITIGPRAPRQGGELAIAASVLVELPEGDVEASLMLCAGRLHVDLVVETDALAARLVAGQRELTAALAEAGFPGSAVRTTTDRARLVRARTETAAPTEAPPAGGLLDIRV